MKRRKKARAPGNSARASSRPAVLRRPPVLLLTHSGDYFTIDRVAEALDRRGASWRRVDTDEFPSRLLLDVRLTTRGQRVTLDDGVVSLDLSRVPAFWVRRLWPGATGPGRGEVDFEASRACFVDALRLLEGARFVNPLDAEARAEAKLLQLALARTLGLPTPDTLATNSGHAVRDFASGQGALVTKLLVPAAVSMGGSPDFVYTHALERADLKGLTRRPQLFQPRVDKVRDWRVVVVGERCFAASLDARSSPTGHLDWRLAQPRDGLTWREEQLPPSVEAKVRRMVKRLGLTFGAFDFLEVARRQLVFLEVNPAGEYGWLERDLGLPISDAIAEELTREAR